MNLRALRGFLSYSSIVTQPNESKKTSDTFLAISMSLTLESVALCVTCQGCISKKKKGKFYQH